MNALRRLSIAASSLAASFLPSPLPAQPPVVEGRVEVLEVGVLADLPAKLRGRSADELASRLTILEDGVARQPVSVDSLGGVGADDYGRVALVFDTARCSAEILRAAARSLGAQAERLTALGPVEVATLGERLEAVAPPTRSAGALAKTLAGFAESVACGAPPAPDRLESIALGAEELACPARPCLLAWAGPGWGRAPAEEGGAAPPPSSAEIEPLARALASGGWAFLAVPISRDESPSAGRHIAEPESRPGSTTYTFGINVLERRRGQRKLSPDEYSSFLDVWLAPLHRLVGATAGEFVASADRLLDALDSLAGRSMLYYRTERRPGGEPPRLEVRAPGETGERYRTAEWAPVVAR